MIIRIGKKAMDFIVGLNISRTRQYAYAAFIA
jgi:hypothetical protein